MPQTVDDQIAAARIYASEVLGTAYGSLAQAQTAIADIPGIVDNGAPRIDIAAPVPVAPEAPPQYEGSHFNPQSFDGFRPDLLNLPSYVFPTAPNSPSPDLTFDAPNKPSGVPNAKVLGEVPDTSDIIIPTAPNLLAEIQGIQAPILTDIDIPDAPVFQAPEFQGVRPTLAIAMPTNLQQTMRDEYARISPIMVDALTTNVDAWLAQRFPSFASGLDALENKITTYMAGGTAVDPDVEDAIQGRSQTKNDAESRRQVAAILKAGAARGFTIPSVSLLSQVATADQARRDANAESARSIAIKTFELEQANAQFVMTASSQLRQAMIQAELTMAGHYVQINGQALDYARSVVDAIVKAFDIAARYAEIQARLYESDARVYEAKLKGALAYIEAFTAEVRALEAVANVDTAKVNAYKARLEGVQAEANVYRAVVDGLTAQASIERLKVDIYQARTQAYVAQVNAYSAEWGAYKAALDGETAKLGAGVEQYRAFTAQVAAYGEEVRAKVAELEGVARANEALVRMYQADVSAFAAKVNAESEAVKAEVASYETTLKGYVANFQAVAEHARAEQAAYQTGLQGLIESAKIFQQYVFANANINQNRAKGQAEVAEKLGEIYGKVAMSTLSGINSLVSRSATE